MDLCRHSGSGNSCNTSSYAQAVDLLFIRTMNYREERELHRKKLTATEKRQKIQLLKTAGATQKEAADELKCSLRLVRYYWNVDEYISKQELNKANKSSLGVINPFRQDCAT